MFTRGKFQCITTDGYKKEKSCPVSDQVKYISISSVSVPIIDDFYVWPYLVG